MNKIRTRWIQAAVVALFAAALVVGVGTEAQAQKKAKSVQTEAKWVKFDPEAKIVVVEVIKPGRIRDKKLKKEFKRGKEVTFGVKPTGSVLTRTTVAINGVKAELTDIEPGKKVNVYWVPDEAYASGKFARKIDVVLSEEELAEKYGFED